MVLRVPVVGKLCDGRNSVEQFPSNGDAAAFNKSKSPSLNLKNADMLVCKGNTQEYWYCETLCDDEQYSKKPVTEPY